MEGQISQHQDHLNADIDACFACGYLIRTSSPNCPECGVLVGHQPMQLTPLLSGIGINTYATLSLAITYFLAGPVFNHFRLPADCSVTNAQRAAAQEYFRVWAGTEVVILAIFYALVLIAVIRRIIEWKLHNTRIQRAAAKISLACLIATATTVSIAGISGEVFESAYFRFFVL